jgi:site-specific recombinase XerD
MAAQRNIDNPRTRRAYRVDIHDFMGFVVIKEREEFRKVTRAHVLAWRKDLEERELGVQPSGASSRRSPRSSSTSVTRTP